MGYLQPRMAGNPSMMEKFGEPVDEAATINQVIQREWTPGSWRNQKAEQMATYNDQTAYVGVMDKLSKVPSLVRPREVDRLTALLAAAGRGERFIIQGGDCAERFVDCQTERLENQLAVLVQMSAIIERAAGTPGVRIARIAGQYGKPRSKPTEVVEGLGEVMSFKGDNINGFEAKERAWDPSRLLEGYWHSAATLNFLRSVRADPDFSQDVVNSLNIEPLESSPSYDSWSCLVSGLKESPPDVASDTVFTSHEAMQLDLEEALTRQVPGKGYYNLSAHMVWVGDRTRQITGSHIEYFRGIRNPIGCKVGPTMSCSELRQLVHILNPDHVEGRLVLITRYGNSKIDALLPEHIKAVQQSGVPVVWQADGMHGNTFAACNKLKTRKFDDVLGECLKALRIHKAHGTVLAGVHLELTGGTTVTECTGGCVNIDEQMLTTNYESYCDPRLNYDQAIEAAFTLGDALHAE